MLNRPRPNTSLSRDPNTELCTRLSVNSDDVRPVGGYLETATMAEDAAISEETLTSGLSLLVSLGKILLQNAEQEAAASLESFVPHKITTLFGLITAGEDFYRSIGVKTKGEAEAVWQKSHHQPAVREQVEELLKLEKEWDSFLLSLDKGLQMTDEELSGAKTVDSLSPDSLFTDARSGESVTLGQFLGQGQKLLLANQTLLEARSVQVMVVSFGNVEGAQLWLEGTGCTFKMLMDSQRKVYRSLGLGSSFSKVLKFGCLMQFSEYSIANRDFPDVPHRLLEDIYQLGGDVLLDEMGKVLFSHPSKDPLDRPSLTDVLQAAVADSTGPEEKHEHLEETLLNNSNN
ncbi:hypothetical protein CHARACLAT_021413 [Characodon lateralis]|uniref:Selenoprotein L n=1 Tax=Characodon lateralis TaxID=208331 RepID=A0ABU7F5B8_9TELE|nr:hypothetical protein [Characodon lateralis]